MMTYVAISHSTSADTEKFTASLTNIIGHANQVISLSDIRSLVAVSGKAQKQLEKSY